MKDIEQRIVSVALELLADLEKQGECPELDVHTLHSHLCENYPSLYRDIYYGMVSLFEVMYHNFSHREVQTTSLLQASTVFFV